MKLVREFDIIQRKVNHIPPYGGFSGQRTAPAIACHCSRVLRSTPIDIIISACHGCLHIIWSAGNRGRGLRPSLPRIALAGRGEGETMSIKESNEKE